MVKKWIQKTKMKSGALRRQLGIPIEEDIPIGLLEEIKKTKNGEVISSYKFLSDKSYTQSIKITPLLKRRANLALNLKRINR